MKPELTELRAQLLHKLNTEISLDPSVVIESDTDLLLTGLVDSLGLLETVGWLEDTMDVEIDPGDIVLEHFQTPELMVTFLETLVAPGS